MAHRDRCSTRTRISLLVVTAVSAAMLWVGCGGDSGEGPKGSTAADVKEEAGEAVDTARDYLDSERRELIQRAELALEGTKADLTDAKRELARLPEEARVELEQAIERADEAGEDLDRELSDLQKAGADQLAEVEQRLEATLEELAEARREISEALRGHPEQVAG